MHLIKTHLMIELDFEIYVFSMELQSFEKPYVALLNSSNRAYKQPLPVDGGGISKSTGRRQEEAL